MNDNERKGLPADFDLLETAVANLKRKPHDIRRLHNLHNIMKRVEPQIKERVKELRRWHIRSHHRMDMNRLTIVNTNGLFYEDELIQTYDDDKHSLDMIIYFRENDIKSYEEFAEHLDYLRNKVCTRV